MLLAAALLARGGPGVGVDLVDVAVDTSPGGWRAPRAEATGPLTRWTIRTAVPFDAGRESWGDLHFARALAAALGAVCAPLAGMSGYSYVRGKAAERQVQE